MSLIDWLREQLGLPRLEEDQQPKEGESPWFAKGPPPPVTFNELHVVGTTPKLEELEQGQMYLVEHRGRRYWTMFRCPCGCGEPVTLMAESETGPTWKTWLSKDRRPSLSPSVWRMAGCYSHFWVDDGRVYWCAGSGRQPWIAAPDYYREPE